MRSHIKIRHLNIPLLWVAPFVIFELLYVLAANVFINGAMLSEIINGSPKEFHLHYERAWTVFPGYVHIRKLSLGGHNGRIEWDAKIESVQALINPLALFKRKLDVRSVRGDLADYQMRWHSFEEAAKEKVEEDKKKSEEAAEVDKGPKRPPFQFEISQVSIRNFRRIAVHGYEYHGSATVQGGFFLWPNRQFRLEPAAVTFENGELRKGGRPVAQDFHGDVRAAIADFFDQEQAEEEMLDGLNSSITLQAKLQDADFLNLYLENLKWLRMNETTGTLDAKIEIAGGVLQPATHVLVRADKLAASLGSLVASGHGLAEWKVTAKELDLAVSLVEYGIHKEKEKKKYIEGKNLKIVATSQDLALKKLFSSDPDLMATINLPLARIIDIRFVNSFLPARDQFEFLSGQGQVNARVSVATKRKADDGFLHLVTKNLGARFEKTFFKGGLEIDTRFSSKTDELNKYSVGGTAIGLNGIEFGITDKNTDEAPPPKWNGKVQVLSGYLRPERPLFIGRVQLDFEDARPFLFLFAGNKRIAPELVKLLSLRNLQGSADLALDKNLIDVQEAAFKSAALNVQGKIKIEDEKKSGIALFRHGVIELGIKVDDEKVDFKVFNAKKWYEKLSNKK